MSRRSTLILLGMFAAAGCTRHALGNGGMPDGSVNDAAVMNHQDGDMPDGSVNDAAVMNHQDASGDPDADVRCESAWGGDIQTGTTGDDQILGMALDSSNNLYTAGYEAGINRVTNIEPTGDSRAIVSKYSSDGTLRWKTTIDTSATETAEAVTIDPVSGNLFVVGRTSGALDGFANQGQFDLFLAVLQPNGQVLSKVQLGNERPQHPLRLRTRDGNRILVTGFDDTYAPNNAVLAPEDGFVASLTVDPTHEWKIETRWWNYLIAMPMPLSPYTRFWDGAFERDGSGELYVVGTGDVTQQLRGAFALKLNADGGLLWSNPISPFALDAVTAVALSPSGDLFVSGGTVRKLGDMSFGQEDAYVMKLDKKTGATIWAAQAGGPDSELATALGFDASGNIYIAGVTLGSVIAGVQNRGEDDLFAMKFDQNGRLVKSWQTGTTRFDWVTSMVVTPCGEVLLGGYTDGDLAAPNLRPGTDDFFIVKADL
jgi:WD40 repeat protein